MKVLVSDLNSDLNFFISNNKTNGVIAKKPMKNLTALKVNGPILSIPVSWAIKVVPQIKVHNKALSREIVFDITYIKQLTYKQNFCLDFLWDHYWTLPPQHHQ